MDSETGAAVRHKRIWTQFRKAWARIRTSQFWMVAIALFLRVGWIVVGHTYKFKSAENNFGFGWEMGRIGAAIASGRGFSDAFGTPTGPTAWEPPMYPYLIAGVFHVFGIYSRASAFILLSINSVFSALTCIPIFLIARRMFSEKVAVGAAWTWALLPYVMFWCTRWVWETSLSALLLGCNLLAGADPGRSRRINAMARVRIAVGNRGTEQYGTGCLSSGVGSLGWYRRVKRHKRSFAGIVLASLIFIACVTPWTVRNYRTFGKFILVRDNFGAELRLGNGPGADGTWMQYLHPTQDVYAMRLYTSMGELAFIKRSQRHALDYIEADYGRFAVLCLKRFIYFWAGPPRLAQIWWLAEVKNSLFLASSVLMFWGLGRALRQRKPGAWLMFWLILLYPAIYYVVYPGQRYRHPIEPEMTILGIFLLTEAGKKNARNLEE